MELVAEKDQEEPVGEVGSFLQPYQTSNSHSDGETGKNAVRSIIVIASEVIE